MSRLAISGQTDKPARCPPYPQARTLSGRLGACNYLGVRLGWLSVAPEVLEAARRQLGVAHRRLDRAMAQVRLQRPGVGATVGEHIPG